MYLIQNSITVFVYFESSHFIAFDVISWWCVAKGFETIHPPFVFAVFAV